MKTWTSEATSTAWLIEAAIVLLFVVSTDADAKDDAERLRLRLPSLPDAIH